MNVRDFIKRVRNRIFGQWPNLPEPLLPHKNSPLTEEKVLLISADPSFDKNVKNASTLIKMGFARGWSQVCGSAKIVDVRKLVAEATTYDRPAIFLTIYDLSFLSDRELIALRTADCFVWISIHPSKIKEFSGKVLADEMGRDFKIWRENYRKVVTLEPKFIWNSTGKRGFHWYEGWVRDGFKWETMHPAADESIYFPEINVGKYGGLEMAYVGGYWAEKAQAFDLYLRPWEGKIHVYGYAKWPYKNYHGPITETEERQLYSTARVIPLVTTPAGWLLTEITERYFKAPACRAFCIADENSAVGEIFTPEEMIQAKNSAHFHELVKSIFRGETNFEKWRERGYQAVLSRHLYRHRALQIKRVLGTRR